MRSLRELDCYRVLDRRVQDAYGWAGDETCGAFDIASPTDRSMLLVIATSGDDWDHVSVSRATRCPNWPEMEHVRRLFFKEDEAAMQYHAPLNDYVDGKKFGHPYCLHLWRPQRAEIPAPPKWMVGGMAPTELLEAREKDLAAQRAGQKDVHEEKSPT